MKKESWGNDLLKTPQTMSEQVYELLREKILSQEIKPGELLLEVGVSEALGISRTPVREAFRMLQHDGLVVRNPRGGVKVTELTLEELKEVSDLRMVFEAYSIGYACDKITDEELGALEKTIREIDAIFADAGPGQDVDLIRLGQLNARFHEILYEAADSLYLKKILEIISLPMLRYGPFSLETRRQREQSWQEHKLIISLLKARDKKGLKKLIRKHVKDAAAAIARKLKEKKTHGRSD